MAAVYINREEGLKRVMNNKKLYIRLLTKFKTGTNIDELLAFIQAQDYEKAQIAAHTLKGLSGNLALTALYEQSIAIEALIKEHTVETAAVDALTACFNDTLKAIDEVLAANE
jgi:HPt (histidine-containing phosphotransfer) domain-containing protein